MIRTLTTRLLLAVGILLMTTADSYGSNSWSYTRLGRIQYTSLDELKSFLKAGQDRVSVTLSVAESKGIKTTTATIQDDKVYAMLISGMLAACTQKTTNEKEDTTMTKLELTQEWDKVFPLSEKVNHKKVTFGTQHRPQCCRRRHPYQGHGSLYDV